MSIGSVHVRLLWLRAFEHFVTNVYFDTGEIGAKFKLDSLFAGLLLGLEHRLEERGQVLLDDPGEGQRLAEGVQGPVILLQFDSDVLEEKKGGQWGRVAFTPERFFFTSSVSKI